MIDYFIKLFTMPNYQWSLLDGLAFACLILVLLVVIYGIAFIVWVVIERLKEKRYSSCKGIINGNICYHHKDCLNCPYYKKKKGR